VSQSDVSAKNEGAILRELVYLWFDVASTHVLMWIANPTGLHGFQPHVHLYLADQYGRLAVAYGRRSRFGMADRMKEKARFHFDLGGGDEPPPAAALSLGSRQRRILVDAEALVDPSSSKGKGLRLVPKKPPDNPDHVGSGL
jgi:hypothetical protein